MALKKCFIILEFRQKVFDFRDFRETCIFIRKLQGHRKITSYK